MRAQFYGTRGSIASPGPGTVRYGGNTSCVLIRSRADTLIVLDMGTGAAVLGRELSARGGNLRGHLLIGHTHWDHIQGLPFFAPLFTPGNEWDIYAPKGVKGSLRDTLAGQMRYTYFPVELEQLGATIRYHELVEGTFRVEEVDVTTCYLNHPALVLGYRLECDGATVVYSCDHEPYSRGLAAGTGEITGRDREHAAFLRGADVVIHDAQYLASEYSSKIGWGHSTAEYAVAIARFAGVKRLALTHHDPMRTDAAIDAMLDDLRSRTDPNELEIFAAAEGQEIEVVGESPSASAANPQPTSDIRAALTRSCVLMIVTSETSKMLRKALASDEIEIFESELGTAAASVARVDPSVVVIEKNQDADLSRIALIVHDLAPTPVLLVTTREDVSQADAHRFIDQLVEPFSPSYARARIHAAVMRRACRWQRAGKPDGEAGRLAALRRLSILDTPPEERFDRITRLAAAVFDVPIALVTFVDAKRQWFKSVLGLHIREWSRDESFCAYAIRDKRPVIVRDTLMDDRFAESPLVVGPPRIRFYAGYPLILADGHCVGTVCVADIRPRDLDERERGLLKDLAQLAAGELERAI